MILRSNYDHLIINAVVLWDFCDFSEDIPCPPHIFVHHYVCDYLLLDVHKGVFRYPWRGHFI